VTTETVNGIDVQIAETEDYKGSGVTYSSSWFQYCGVESYGGIDPAYESDNLFISGASPPYDWQGEAFSEGEPLRADAFDEYETWGNGIGRPGLGQPAAGTWRSQEAEDVIPIQVIRSPLVEEKAQDDPWLQASTENGFIAWLNKCTHFCCVPGYKQAADAAKFGGENDVYCQCHQSIYDPFTVVETLFTARPRPE
jgi:nitrite reductase/ring-hydroxylating ferredoxin subunit